MARSGPMPENERPVKVGDRITLYQRGKKKTWVADFWQDGVHRRVSMRTGNKKVATGRATILAADLTQGKFHPSPRAVTFRETVNEYLESLTTSNRAKKTLVKYRGVFRQL